MAIQPKPQVQQATWKQLSDSGRVRKAVCDVGGGLHLANVCTRQAYTFRMCSVKVALKFLMPCTGQWLFNMQSFYTIMFQTSRVDCPHKVFSLALVGHSVISNLSMFALLSSHTCHRQQRCPPIIYAGKHPAVANGLPSSVCPQAITQQWTEAIVQDEIASPGKIPSETVSQEVGRPSIQAAEGK